MVTYVKRFTMWKHLFNAFCKKVERISLTVIKISLPMWHMYPLQHALCTKVVWQQHNQKWSSLIAFGNKVRRIRLMYLLSNPYVLTVTGLARMKCQVWGLAGQLSLFSMAIERKAERLRALSFQTLVDISDRLFFPFNSFTIHSKLKLGHSSTKCCD